MSAVTHHCPHCVGLQGGGSTYSVDTASVYTASGSVEQVDPTHQRILLGAGNPGQSLSHALSHAPPLPPSRDVVRLSTLTASSHFLLYCVAIIFHVTFVALTCCQCCFFLPGRLCRRSPGGRQESADRLYKRRLCTPASFLARSALSTSPSHCATCCARTPASNQSCCRRSKVPSRRSRLPILRRPSSVC